MNKKAFAGLGVAVTMGLTAATAAAGAGCYYGVKWLVKNSHSTPIPGVDGKPFPNSRYYREGDYSIHYRIDMATTPQPIGKIFMIHGFGCNTTFYDEMIEIYTRLGFTCVRVDAPNCGFSTRENEHVAPIDREVLFSHVIDLVDASGLVVPGKWLLMGHSMGGGISMNMAYDNPERFNAVILYAPMKAVNAPDFVKNIVTLKPMCHLMDVLFQPAASWDPLMKAVVMLMTVDVRYSMLYDVPKFADGLTVDGTGTGMCYMMARARPTLPENMAKVTLPIQLVWGDMDLFNAKSTVRAFQGALTNPDVTEMRLVGHCLVQNAADEVCKGTMAFLHRNGLYC